MNFILVLGAICSIGVVKWKTKKEKDYEKLGIRSKEGLRQKEKKIKERR